MMNTWDTWGLKVQSLESYGLQVKAFELSIGPVCPDATAVCVELDLKLNICNHGRCKIPKKKDVHEVCDNE